MLGIHLEMIVDDGSRENRQSLFGLVVYRT